MIAQLLRDRGSLSVTDVEREFGVSAMTARRDFAALEEDGLALRTYGGAMLPAAAAVEGSFDQRLTVDAEAKRRVAKSACELISDGETIFADSSTVAYFVTQELIAAGRKVTIATNSLPVLELLRRANGIQVIALGGTYQPDGARFVGPDTVRAVQALAADKAVMSATGLTNEGLLTDADRLEAEVKRTILEHSNESILLIAASELRTRGMSVFGRLATISLVLHTDDITDEEASQLRKHAPNLRQI